MINSDRPAAIIPSIVGRAKHRASMIGLEQRDHFVGTEAQAKRGVLALKYPIEHGVVRDWESMEKIWNHVFRQALRVEPAEHPVMLTEVPWNPRPCREQSVQMLFENFQIPGCYLNIQAVLALYSSGRLTGCVADSGDSVTYSLPVYEGYALPNTVVRSEVSGRDLTEFMVHELSLRGSEYNLKTNAEKEIARDIKEKTTFIAPDFEEMSKIAANNPEQLSQRYELPDGRELFLIHERFRCPEALFQPRMMNKDGFGLAQCIVESIKAADIDLRKQLYGNIVLCGGNTMFDGIADRIEKEMQKPFAQVHAPENRTYSVWIGGSILSSLSTFQSLWISKREYDETGVNIVHRKCPAM